MGGSGGWGEADEVKGRFLVRSAAAGIKWADYPPLESAYIVGVPVESDADDGLGDKVYKLAEAIECSNQQGPPGANGAGYAGTSSTPQTIGGA